jgi:hypothetical protein
LGNKLAHQIIFEYCKENKKSFEVTTYTLGYYYDTFDKAIKERIETKKCDLTPKIIEDIEEVLLSKSSLENIVFKAQSVIDLSAEELRQNNENRLREIKEEHYKEYQKIIKDIKQSDFYNSIKASVIGAFIYSFILGFGYLIFNPPAWLILLKNAVIK